MKTSTLIVTLLLATTFSFAGCHEATEGVDAPASTYTATDFAFDGPGELETGWNEITIKNDGQQLHHIYLFRLDEGKTEADLIAALEAREHPEWAHHVGGPNTAMPGESVTAWVDLEPGTHVMVCEIPDPEGTPHFAHGMHQAIEVSEADTEADAPKHDTTLSLRDFSFGMPDPAGGQQVVQVTNDGGQPHEAALVKLEEGATAMDFIGAFAPDAQGPPPGRGAGGYTGLEPGETAYFQLDLEPGDYAYICFLQDPESGKPHFQLGMIEEFTVE
ncbi:MAG: hypothetical protein KY455_03805 [Euryarchaeota archaeon]|nr:hypothetical protein [Euryarchaeota archaeon]